MAPLKLPLPDIPLPEGFWKLFQPPDNSLPEIVRKRFEPKRGYANYYFNKLNQQRVWKAWNAGTNLEGRRDAWTLSGPLDGGGKYRIQLTDAGASLKVPAADTKWTAGNQWDSSLLPAHSGGLLPALYLMLTVVGREATKNEKSRAASHAPVTASRRSSRPNRHAAEACSRTLSK